MPDTRNTNTELYFLITNVATMTMYSSVIITAIALFILSLLSFSFPNHRGTGLFKSDIQNQTILFIFLTYSLVCIPYV